MDKFANYIAILILVLSLSLFLYVFYMFLNPQKSTNPCDDEHPRRVCNCIGFYNHAHEI